MLAPHSTSPSFSSVTSSSTERHSTRQYLTPHYPVHHPKIQVSDRRNRLYSAHSTPSLQHSYNTDWRAEPYSSPLPQTQWSEDLPPRQQRRSYESQGKSSAPLAPRPKAGAQRQPQVTQIETQGMDESPTSRKRRRRRGFLDFISRPEETRQNPQFDVSRLHPQAGPSGDRLSTYSAPDELEHYQVQYISQTSVPGYMVLSSPSPHDDPPPMSIPRSPTYPPAGRRRMHSSTGVGDAAFEDEADFRLFVEATAGLGPEQAYREPHGPSHPHQRSYNHDLPPLPRPATTGAEISPLGETPTTMRAMQQVAQFPESTAQNQGQGRPQSVSHLDRWLQSPGQGADVPEISPLEDFDEFDDELPDYAESQAQAQAHQRAEAARRAQELQRKWQQSGARRGF